MIFLLDTNTCIKFINGSSSSVRANFQRHNPTDLALCSVVKAELFYGVAKSRRKEHNLGRLNEFFAMFSSLPFDDRAAEIFGSLRGQLESQGKMINTYDLQIASIALANNLIVATNNVREFSQVPGLRIEDWE